MKPFQLIVIQHPSEDGRNKGEVSKIVVDIKTVLANNAEGAAAMASKFVPEGLHHLLATDQLQIIVRPFQ